MYRSLSITNIVKTAFVISRDNSCRAILESRTFFSCTCCKHLPSSSTGSTQAFPTLSRSFASCHTLPASRTKLGHSKTLSDRLLCVHCKILFSKSPISTGQNSGPGSGTFSAGDKSQLYSSIHKIIKRLFSGSRALCDEEDTSSPEEDKMFKRTRKEVNRREQECQKWKETKGSFADMSLEEKREHYKCGDYHVVLDDVPTWGEYYKDNQRRLGKLQAKASKNSTSEIDEELNSKVSIWQGDITALEIDSIVNAANGSLMGGGGVDGAIHRAAGSVLVQECASLNGCDTGDAKITGGYKLPAKYVIHTVGPVGSGDNKLHRCYKKSLEIMVKNELRATAFPCISTGIYGFPNERAAHIVLNTVRAFLEEKRDQVDRVIFCLFLPKDVSIYERLMLEYFPVKPVSSEEESTSDTDEGSPQGKPKRLAKKPGTSNTSSVKTVEPVDSDASMKSDTETGLDDEKQAANGVVDDGNNSDQNMSDILLNAVADEEVVYECSEGNVTRSRENESQTNKEASETAADTQEEQMEEVGRDEAGKSKKVESVIN